jgi:ElaB/YqjD/DUF883 family membrane-anchored ribosome-binding protein
MTEETAPPPKKRATSSKTAASKAAAMVTAVETVATQGAEDFAAGAESIRDQASSFKTKASDKAREYATAGKDKTADLLDSLSHTVDDLARSVDERLGTTYGDYARKAASAVSGMADTLKGKDVDDLVENTRDFVRKQPVVAIGAAAAVGFLLTRLLRAGSNERDDA